MSQRLARRPLRISSRKTLSDNWYRLEKVVLEHEREDGSHQMLEREVYHNGPGAAVLPIDRARGTVLLVRQLRTSALVNGDPPWLVEACAGMIDPGDDPETTIYKEIDQETGYRLHTLRKVFELYMSPGASAEKLHLFIAEYRESDRVGRGGGLGGEDEEIEVFELPLSKAWEMVEDREIIDAKTVLLLQHLRLAGN